MGYGDKDESSQVNDIQKFEVSVKNSDSGSFGGAKLNGANFRKWKKIMTAHLRGMHKIGHVTGVTKAPNADAVVAYTKWDDDDGLVMFVLFKAMNEEILDLVAECDTAHAIWTTLEVLFTNDSDFIQVHELMCTAFAMHQDGQPVAQYFTKLKNIWAEIDVKRPCMIKNHEDIVWYQKEKEIERVHHFLKGLDAKHNSAKCELLRKTEPPSLITAFTFIRKDESQHESLHKTQVEVSSLTVQATSPTPSLQPATSAPLHKRGPPPGFGTQPRPPCSYCHDTNHARATCWKLYPHLRPQRPNYRPKAKAAIQLVPEPDIYGVVGHDHHTTGGATPTSSIAGRGSSHRGFNWSGVSKGQVVSSGSDVCGEETRGTIPDRFALHF
ncbi:uncharacterized protein LOC126793805 isoform X3 [Argentina anserina]|uniref:uncharacterized protein LOC126793805 isoform X3 n=1 Tax=Argentina anserina TaxID=57926 RepID=UPI00217635BB|nr:uncharacterized protein LOC126793805 isoform X3 [Potentilla anserina]